VHLQSTITAFDFYGWRLSLFFVLLRDGTILGSDLMNTDLVCADSEPFPTKAITLRDSTHCKLSGPISAVSATLDGAMYVISNGRVLEYSVSVVHPYHWVCKGKVWT
jgi:hypothetical protein